MPEVTENKNIESILLGVGHVGQAVADALLRKDYGAAWTSALAAINAFGLRNHIKQFAQAVDKAASEGDNGDLIAPPIK